jgi:hypothetical protein
VGFDKACRDRFQEAFDHHASVAAIFIGKGRDDKEVQVRFTDADAAIVAGYTTGDGKVLVFANDMSQYYDDKDGGKQAKAAGLGKENAGFARKEIIGRQRDTITVELTPKNRGDLLKSVDEMKARNRGIHFIRPGGPVGVGFEPVLSSVNVEDEMKKAWREGKAAVERGRAP